MSIDQTNTTIVPPALRARPKKHAAPRNRAAKRFAGGAVLSAAIAGGAFAAGPLAGLAGLDDVGSTGTAQAAPCVTGLFCDFVNGSSALFGGSVGFATGATTALTAPFAAVLPLNLIGPGGLLIGDGLDAPADCNGGSISCDGGNGGLLFGSGGKGADAATATTPAHAAGNGGNGGLIGNGGDGGAGFSSATVQSATLPPVAPAVMPGCSAMAAVVATLPPSPALPRRLRAPTAAQAASADRSSASAAPAAPAARQPPRQARRPAA